MLPQSSSIKPSSLDGMQIIATEMRGRYGNNYFKKWASGEIDADGADTGIRSMMEVWSLRLRDERMTRQELLSALAIMGDKHPTWPPTLDEFLALCRPPVDHESAFYEAVEQMPKWSSGRAVFSNSAVYWAAVRIGNDIQRQPYHHIAGRWKAAIDKAVDDMRSGVLPSDVPKPELHKALPPKPRPSADDARAGFMAIRELLGISRTQEASDGR